MTTKPTHTTMAKLETGEQAANFLANLIPCDNCDESGWVIFSCCGDDLRGSDTYMCPTCHEHCGDEKEECEECLGEGYVSK